MAPFLQIVQGDPTPEEIAALVTVLTARASAATAPPEPRPRSAWSDPSRRLRHTLPHGPGAWRASSLPA
ncbi:acyl-CoA carboxylase subunit epsilon [Actinoallomurus acaciae]|uniref:Acyl-CoA carboxylase subunit epsilon n=1 Tax=Actinoallomurus acaciae TaxID=502577 RepID=A0ABV5YRE6_9ACTN